jgi:GNAT superfamily N-acetyltransferase
VVQLRTAGLVQPVHHPEDRLQKSTALVPPILQFGHDLIGLALGLQALLPEFSSFLFPDGPESIGFDSRRFDHLFVLCSPHLHLGPCCFGARPPALRLSRCFGYHHRQFLSGHGGNPARGDRTRRAQIGEILRRVSVISVTFSLEPVDRADPRVQPLYADFIHEADGPLVYDRAEAGINLDEEIAKGPPSDLVPPNGVLLLAFVDGEPAGLGGVRHLDTDVAEVKSMYVAPAFRGTGLGRRILARLDEIALEYGCRAVRLDTSDYLTPAVGLYRAAGYREVPAYNENPKADLWFERSLQE